MRRQFTLVEMMIAVAIVSLLAAIAVPAMQSYMMRSKEAEAGLIVDGIRVAEMSYNATFDTVFVANFPNGYPQPGKALWDWTDGPPWSYLGYKPDGKIRGLYNLIAPDTPNTAWLARGCMDVDMDLACTVVEADETQWKEIKDGVTGLPNCGCFPAGTQVTLGDGSSTAIESIQPGDRVLAYDADGELSAHPVDKLWRIGRRDLLEVALTDGSSLLGTATHPVFTGVPAIDGNDDPRAWTRLGDLRPGDLVTQLDGEGGLEVLAVDSVLVLSVAEPVFTLSVRDAHTFFAEGVLVHNKTAGCGELPDTLVGLPDP